MHEYAIKVVLSALAVAFFGAIGLAALRLAPPLPRRAARADAVGPTAQDAGVPVPPDTRQLFATDTSAGRQWLYESRLSEEGVTRFYMQEMPRHGWRWDEAFEAARRARTPGQSVLAFKTQRAICIIGIEPSSTLSTAVTVLVVNRAQREGGTL